MHAPRPLPDFRSCVCVCVPRASSLKRRCQLDKRTNPHPKGVGDSSRPVGSAHQVGERRHSGVVTRFPDGMYIKNGTTLG